MPEQEAVSTPQQPSEAPVTGNAEGQAAPSGDAKPDMFSLSPLGESWKDVKINPTIAEKLPSFLKSEHLTPELFDYLSDPTEAKLFFSDISGYRKAENSRLEAAANRQKELDAIDKSLSAREISILAKEKELLEIEGDAYFARDEKVKRITRDAQREAEELGLDEERTQTYVNRATKPYIEAAKDAHQKQVADKQAKIESIMAENDKIAATVFPEFSPTITKQIVDGFVLNGAKDAKSSADLFRQELDRIIEYRERRAVADALKGINKTQPNTPVQTPGKPIPSAAEPNEYSELVKQGRALFGGIFGG